MSAPRSSDAPPAPATSDDATSSADVRGPGRARRAALVAVTVSAVIALAAAVWFGVGWGRALLVDRAVADTRDAALSGAVQAAVNLNSVDAADVDRSIENMRSSITGDALRNDLEATEQDIRARVAETGTSMSAEPLFGTLTELNTDDDLGKALVVLAVRTSTPEYFVTNKVPVIVSLRKDGDVWKAETIEPLASVELESGPAPGAAPPEAPAPAPGGETAPEGEAGP